MNRGIVDRIVNAVLYEGYILYPYRASSKKNQRERFTFGRVYPRQYSDAQNGREPFEMQTECLIKNESRDATLEITLQFLQPLARTKGDELWLEALEREVKLPALSLNNAFEQVHEFNFSSRVSIDDSVRRQNEAISGRIKLKTTLLDRAVVRVGVRIFNETPMSHGVMGHQNEIIMRTFASTHTILHTLGGEFVSLLDPDPRYADLVMACKNIGTWPVLVGDQKKRERDTMLSSPIILYDYPKIAGESAGDLFDGTEIDEILTLRVKTMTDEEKLEMRNTDQHARRILERTENLSAEHFMKMHGTMRDVHASNEEFFNPTKRAESARVRDVDLKKGDRVRIRPKKRADIMDMALDGKIGIIEAIEQDVDDQIHFALILEDDPGKDLGLMRQPGHRFFYSADEVEPV